MYQFTRMASHLLEILLRTLIIFFLAAEIFQLYSVTYSLFLHFKKNKIKIRRPIVLGVLYDVKMLCLITSISGKVPQFYCNVSWW
jgi:hypothetical protein